MMCRLVRDVQVTDFQCAVQNVARFGAQSIVFLFDCKSLYPEAKKWFDDVRMHWSPSALLNSATTLTLDEFMDEC